jgi:hypothetical protein
MMDAIDDDRNEIEISPYDQICPRHGARIHQYHGCPKCVMEEVRRHESRIHAPLENEAPIPAGSYDNGSPLSAEIG